MGKNAELNPWGMKGHKISMKSDITETIRKYKVPVALVCL